MGFLSTDRYYLAMLRSGRIQQLLGQGFYWTTCTLVTLQLGACTTPDAASVSQEEPEDEFAAALVLTAAQQQQVLEAMRSVTQGYEPRPLLVAAEGTRWSDVPMAIRNVAAKQFLGVAALVVVQDECTATLLTADGEGGTVVATRLAEGSIKLTVKIGLFGKPSTEDKFAEAFRIELLRLGKIPKPQE